MLKLLDTMTEASDAKEAVKKQREEAREDLRVTKAQRKSEKKSADEKRLASSSNFGFLLELMFIMLSLALSLSLLVGVE